MDNKTSSSFSERKSELKLNLTNMLIYPAIDLTYERLLNENNSLGLSTFISLVPKEANQSTYLTFYDNYKSLALTAYYRRFFSKGYARGLFLEAFTSWNQGNEVVEIFVSDPNINIITREEIITRSDIALGLVLGAKFVIENHLIIELHFGWGGNLLKNRDYEFTSRGGVSIGYRF